ncbi:uncharacterized protein LOC118426137 [Branchiostoma floridae]|uniref:Uncharacterized protein LOC118426137 n=1 Tax=Branchiostoma floridae TaxID=7739 RepID=A0A9J7M0W1_BRAFL|nr:uncharacterized protein LOC118426137 [Branchiostoma floridae]
MRAQTVSLKMSREVDESYPSLQERDKTRSLQEREKTRATMRRLQHRVGDLEQQTQRIDDEVRSEQCLLLCHFRNLRKNMDKVIDLSSRRRRRLRRKVRNRAMGKSSSKKLSASTDGSSEEEEGKKLQKDTENVSSRRIKEDCDQGDAAKEDASSEGKVRPTRRRFSLPSPIEESLPQLQHQKKCAKSCKLVQRRRYSLPAIQPHDNERHELTKIVEEEEVVVETITARRRLSIPVESLEQLHLHKDCPTPSKDVHRRRHSLPAIQLNQERDELQTVAESDEDVEDKQTAQVQPVETKDETMRKASVLLRQRLFPSIVTPDLDVDHSSIQPPEQKTPLPSEPERDLDTDLEKKPPYKTFRHRASVVCIDGTAVTGSHAEHFHRRQSFPTVLCKTRLDLEPCTSDVMPWLSIGAKSKSRIYAISVDGGYIIKCGTDREAS